MHHCLQVPEILDIIFRYVVLEHNSRQLFVPLVLTCRGFCEVALDLMWHTQTSLVPLFKTLPDELWMEFPREGYDRTFDIGPLKLENVVRLEFYARRIRRLRYLPYVWHSSHRAGPHDLEALNVFAKARKTQCHSGPIFPNLFHLEFIDPAHAVHSLPIFMESNSISLSLHWSESENNKILELFPIIEKHATHMHELDLGSFKDTAGDKCEELSRLVSKMTSLRALACGSRKLTTKALASLTSQRHLSKLQVSNSSKDLLKVVKGDRETFLPTLRHLRIIEDDLPSFVQLLNQMRPIELQSLILAGVATPTALDLANVLKALEGGSRGNLREIAIKQMLPPRTFAVVLNKTVVIDSTALQPLLSFRGLTSISIDLHCTFLLNDVEVTSMAEAWPRLRHLQLGSMRGWGVQSNVTFTGLLALLRLCPDLSYLVLPFDALNYELPDTSTIPPAHTNTKITYLNVSDATPPFRLTQPVGMAAGVNAENDSRAGAVALVLLHVLPNLKGVGGSWLYHGGGIKTSAKAGWMLVGCALSGLTKGRPPRVDEY